MDTSRLLLWFKTCWHAVCPVLNVPRLTIIDLKWEWLASLSSGNPVLFQLGSMDLEVGTTWNNKVFWWCPIDDIVNCIQCIHSYSPVLFRRQYITSRQATTYIYILSHKLIWYCQCQPLRLVFSFDVVYICTMSL